MSEQTRKRITVPPKLTLEMTLIEGVDYRAILGIDKLEQEAAMLEQDRKFRSDVAKWALELKGVRA